MTAERAATACAWYAVGVIDASQLQQWVHMSPCECTVPATVDAGSCDGGYNREFACHLPGPPNRCGMQILPKGIYDPVTKQNRSSNGGEQLRCYGRNGCRCLRARRRPLHLFCRLQARDGRMGRGLLLSAGLLCHGKCPRRLPGKSGMRRRREPTAAVGNLFHQRAALPNDGRERRCVARSCSSSVQLTKELYSPLDGTLRLERRVAALPIVLGGRRERALWPRTPRGRSRALTTAEPQGRRTSRSRSESRCT